MPVNALKRGTAPGMKVYHEAVSVADGDTVDTGLSDVETADATGTAAGRVVNVTNNAAGVLTISLQDDAGAAIGAAETVYVVAYGEA